MDVVFPRRGNVETAFTGGLYLPPLGRLPAADRIETVAYDGPLFLSPPRGPDPLELLVRPGENARRGQLLAVAGPYRLHAPRDGAVRGLDQVWSVHAGRLPAVVLAARPPAPLETPRDQADQPPTPPPAEPPLDREETLRRIEQAGIVDPQDGRPFVLRLRQLEGHAVEAVVANASPLEPMMTAALALLLRYTEEVCAGLTLLQTLLPAERALVAHPHTFRLDRRRTQAWGVLAAAVSEKYPQGLAQVVVRTLRRQGWLRRRPAGQTLVLPVQTLREVDQAVRKARPPLERLVTVCGDGVEHPGHFWAPLGLPLRALLAAAQIRSDARGVVSGGSLTGALVPPDRAAVGMDSEAFTVLRRAERPRPQACIRCGWCLEDCPAGIDPAALVALAETRQYASARRLGVEACLECGICSYLCPSHLRIAEHLRTVKSLLHRAGPAAGAAEAGGGGTPTLADCPQPAGGEGTP